jgi:hypothetical protein
MVRDRGADRGHGNQLLGLLSRGADTVFGGWPDVAVREHRVERVEFDRDQCCAGRCECRRIDHQTFFLI